MAKSKLLRGREINHRKILATLEKAQARIRDLEAKLTELEAQVAIDPADGQTYDVEPSVAKAMWRFWFRMAKVQGNKVRDLESANAALEKRLAERECRNCADVDCGKQGDWPLEIGNMRIYLCMEHHDAAVSRPAADDVSEMRAICAEEGCAAPSEEMRALDTLTEECRALDEEYVCPHCGQRDELCWRGCWRCICGAPEDESGYRPAGEVALELLREMRRPNPHSCACQRQWAARIDAILEER